MGGGKKGVLPTLRYPFTSFSPRSAEPVVFDSFARSHMKRVVDQPKLVISNNDTTLFGAEVRDLSCPLALPEARGS